LTGRTDEPYSAIEAPEAGPETAVSIAPVVLDSADRARDAALAGVGSLPRGNKIMPINRADIAEMS